MEKKKFSLGFSPCPNDTFIFDALVNHKIDTEGIEFEVQLEDVQTLNNWARQGKLDISKISYGVLPLLLDRYAVLKSGGALGIGVGPLLIGKQPPASGTWEELQRQVVDSVVAIPGENTTAHFLFNQAFPEASNKQFRRFDGIEEFVLAENGLGVIIHENRFTYQEKGLHKWVDLGELWEQTTGFPIPLGGIVVSKKIDTDMQHKIDRLIRKSLEYAFENYPKLADYVKMHSQEMSETVMRQHIDLYVNDFSIDVGEAGRAAVIKLLDTLRPGSTISNSIFVEGPQRHA